MESYQTIRAGRVFVGRRSPYNRACDGESDVGHSGDGREVERGGRLEGANQTQTGRLGLCWVCSKAPDCLALVTARGGPESRTSHRALGWRLLLGLPRLGDVEAWFRWRWYSWRRGVVIMGWSALLLSV